MNERNLISTITLNILKYASFLISFVSVVICYFHTFHLSDGEHYCEYSRTLLGVFYYVSGQL